MKLQLLLAVGAATGSMAVALDMEPTKTTPKSIGRRSANFKWTGVSESGAEFGSGTLPGTLGKDYTWPVDSSIDVSSSSSGFLSLVRRFSAV